MLNHVFMPDSMVASAMLVLLINYSTQRDKRLEFAMSIPTVMRRKRKGRSFCQTKAEWPRDCFYVIQRTTANYTINCLTLCPHFLVDLLKVSYRHSAHVFLDLKINNSIVDNGTSQADQIQGIICRAQAT